MPSSQVEINFILFDNLQQERLRLYMIKNSPKSMRKGHWEETQTRNCRKNSKWFLEWDPKEGQIRKLFCKAHLGKSLGITQGIRNLYPFLFLSFRAAPFFLLRNGLLLKILFGKGKALWLNCEDCWIRWLSSLPICDTMCVFYWLVFFKVPGW